MTKEDFVSKIVGTKYINRGYDFDGCDCFGLCYLYYREVEDLNVGLTKEYLNFSDFKIAFNAQLSGWKKIERPENDCCVFVCFSGDIPMHCGIMLDKTRVLHAYGNPSTNEGQAAIWKINVMKRFLEQRYGECRMEYYKWQN